MKISFRAISVILTLSIFFSLVPSVNAVTNDEPKTNVWEEEYDKDYYETCYHSSLYDFDIEAMTVGGVYENNLVEDLLFDIEEYAENHYAVILKAGEAVTDGFLEQGMVVQIYHDDELFGEYMIGELLIPDLQTPDQQTEENSSPTSNQYGFILPLDGLILKKQAQGGHISSSFGDTANRSKPHAGVDFNWPNIVGTPIRAVKSGTVTTVDYQAGGAGHYITINHGGGYATTYMHMRDKACVAKGSTVTQGQIIGYVGNTGGVQGQNGGYHLHFEVLISGVKKDPVPYLQGAGTWKPIPATPNACINVTSASYSLGSSIKTYGTINANEYLSSPNGKYVAKMQGDGNFIIYNSDCTLWATATNGKGIGSKLIYIQGQEYGDETGDIVMYDSEGTILWRLSAQSGVNNRKASELKLQNDGKLVALDSSGSVIWSSQNSDYPHETSVFDIVNISSRNASLNATYGAYSKGVNLKPGESVLFNEYLSSPNRKFIAKMQADGNFAVYSSDRALWVAGTNGKGTGAQYITLQTDGNIVIYDSTGKALWNLWSQPNVNNRKAVILQMQDDGNLVAYDSGGAAIWSTGTYGKAGASAFWVVNAVDKNSRLNRADGAYSLGDTLKPSKRIEFNEYLSSTNKKFIAKMQGDGNFVVYSSDINLWATGTHTTGGKYIALQSDGNIVVYDSSGKAIWNLWAQPNVYSQKAARLVMQDDGNLVAYDSAGKAIWSTCTGGKVGASAFTTTMAAYSVKYNANNGTGTMANSSHTVGAEKALTANTFTRAGYTFQGWATSATGAVVYTDKQNVKDLASNQGVVINLYAVWKPVGNVQSVQDWVLQKSTEPVGDMNDDSVVDVFDIVTLRKK